MNSQLSYHIPVSSQTMDKERQIRQANPPLVIQNSYIGYALLVNKKYIVKELNLINYIKYVQIHHTFSVNSKPNTCMYKKGYIAPSLNYNCLA
jgi:hypothetical protein